MRVIFTVDRLPQKEQEARITLDFLFFCTFLISILFQSRQNASHSMV